MLILGLLYVSELLLPKCQSCLGSSLPLVRGGQPPTARFLHSHCEDPRVAPHTGLSAGPGSQEHGCVPGPTERAHWWPPEGLAPQRLLSLLLGKWAPGLGPPGPERQGLCLLPWLRPQEVLGRPLLERVLVLSALTEALGGRLPQLPSGSCSEGAGAGPASASPALRAPSHQLCWKGTVWPPEALPRSPLSPFPCMAAAELGSKACFLCSKPRVYLLGNSGNAGERRACKSGQEVRKPGGLERPFACGSVSPQETL